MIKSVNTGASGMKMSAVAIQFANGERDWKKLAASVNVHPTTVYRWAKTAHWHKRLDDLGYTGERTLKLNRKEVNA